MFTSSVGNRNCSLFEWNGIQSSRLLEANASSCPFCALGLHLNCPVLVTRFVNKSDEMLFLYRLPCRGLPVGELGGNQSLGFLWTDTPTNHARAARTPQIYRLYAYVLCQCTARVPRQGHVHVCHSFPQITVNLQRMPCTASFSSSARDLLRRQGLRGTVQDLPLYLLKETLGIAAFFFTYEACRRRAFQELASAVSSANAHSSDSSSHHNPDPIPDSKPDPALTGTTAVTATLSTTAAPPLDPTDPQMELKVARLVSVLGGGACAGIAYQLLAHPLHNVIKYQRQCRRPIRLGAFVRTVPVRKWGRIAWMGLPQALKQVMTPAIFGFVVIEAID